MLGIGAVADDAGNGREAVMPLSEVSAVDID